MKHLFLILTLVALTFSSCSEDEDGAPSTKKTTEQVSAKFKQYFCNEDGTLRMLQVGGEEKAWAIASEDAVTPCKVFNDMTGMKYVVASQYDYRYDFPDSQGFLRIKGHATADENGIFAIMYVNIPAYPHVSTIYIGTPKFFNDNYPADTEIPWLYLL